MPALPYKTGPIALLSRATRMAGLSMEGLKQDFSERDGPVVEEVDFIQGVSGVDNLYRQMGSDPNEFDAPTLQQVETDIKALTGMRSFDLKEYGVDLTYCAVGHAMREGRLVTDPERVREAMQLLAGVVAKTGVAVIVTPLDVPPEMFVGTGLKFEGSFIIDLQKNVYVSGYNPRPPLLCSLTFHCLIGWKAS
jgi:hypothetical protein